MSNEYTSCSYCGTLYFGNPDDAALCNVCEKPIGGNR